MITQIEDILELYIILLALIVPTYTQEGHKTMRIIDPQVEELDDLE